jgi:N6-adenosine-specific RNA methylase IME4
MGRPLIGKRPMTATEHQRRWRKKLARKKALENPRLKEKQQRRAEHEAKLAAKQLALPSKRYGVIVADPGWKFKPYSRETGMDRSADNHYATTPTAVIMALDVPSIAAHDCVLFLWVTVPFLFDARDVMEAWGFNYKSHCIWAKGHKGAKKGTGYWFRNEHEILLVGVKRKVPAPAPGTQWSSQIEAPVGAHSAKPDRFLEMIEGFYPNLPKIELYRRGPPRAGWDAWGLEAVT